MAEHLKQRLIKNSILNLVNNALIFATTWFVSIWAARQLGPTNYGIFTLILWLSGTVSWVVGMGLIHAITKFVAEYRGRDDSTMVTPLIMFVLKTELGVSIPVTFLLVLFRTHIADFFFSPRESFFFFLSFLGVIPGVVCAILSATIQGMQRFEYFTLSTLVISPLSLASKIAVLAMGKGISGLLTVMLVFSLINCIFYIVVLRKEGIGFSWRATLEQKVKKRIGSYNGSVSAILLCDKIVWDRSENFFLGRLCPAAEVGFYNLGFNLVQRITSILPQTFWAVLFPAMAHYSGSGEDEKMRRLFYITTRYLAFFSFPVGIAGLMLAFPMVKILYGSEYLGSQRVLQILFVGSIFSNLSNPAAAVLYGYNRQSFIYKYGAFLALLNIGLDLILIRHHGAVGAAICYGITTVCASIGGLVYSCKIMKLRYPVKSVMKILGATALMAIAMKFTPAYVCGLGGSLLTLLVGLGVYGVSCCALGSFQEEDLAIIQSARKVLPKTIGRAIEGIVGGLTELKRTSVFSSGPPRSARSETHNQS